jgi:S1-C subfamily serine protease
MRRFVLIVFLGCCAFAGGLAGTAMAPLGRPVVAQGVPLTSPTDLARLSDRFEQVARRVLPAVVALEASKPAIRGGKARAVEESGSGVLIRLPEQRGTFVLTNNHVVQQAGPEQITVGLADSRLMKPTRVWADPESDIAILRLEADDLPAATLGDSDQARVGRWVLAMGSPFGLNQTVTHGIISAVNRGQVSLGSTIRIKDFLQTDAAINPGSSGGPLVNLDGEVIGINTAIASPSGSNSGVAFSIPINLVKRVQRQLMEKGAVARGYLGLQVASSFEATDAARLGLDRAQGALVETVYADTPAAAAGLRTNDVVLQVDGVPIRNENHFINLISGLAAGQRIRLQVWRDRRTVALEAVVGDWSLGQSRFRNR